MGPKNLTKNTNGVIGTLLSSVSNGFSYFLDIMIRENKIPQSSLINIKTETSGALILTGAEPYNMMLTRISFHVPVCLIQAGILQGLLTQPPNAGITSVQSPPRPLSWP